MFCFQSLLFVSLIYVYGNGDGDVQGGEQLREWKSNFLPILSILLLPYGLELRKIHLGPMEVVYTHGLIGPGRTFLGKLF